MAASGKKRKNLSEPELKKKIYSTDYHIAIVSAQWNKVITDRLLRGAEQELIRQGIAHERLSFYEVPGCFELSLAAAWCAGKIHTDAVICLGCLIKGETPHFDYIASAVAHGLTEVSIRFQKPVIFGVITALTMKQAMERAGGSHGNKGTEAALTCLEMLELRKKII